MARHIFGTNLSFRSSPQEEIHGNKGRRETKWTIWHGFFFLKFLVNDASFSLISALVDFGCVNLEVDADAPIASIAALKRE